MKSMGRTKYKRIYCCGDCVQYNWKKHKCKLGANKEENAQDHFFSDCPLPTYEEEECEKDIISEAFAAKLTIDSKRIDGIFKKEATIEVADRYGNKFYYNITDAKSIQKMLEEYDAEEGDNNE